MPATGCAGRQIVPLAIFNHRRLRLIEIDEFRRRHDSHSRVEVARDIGPIRQRSQAPCEAGRFRWLRRPGPAHDGAPRLSGLESQCCGRFLRCDSGASRALRIRLLLGGSRRSDRKGGSRFDRLRGHRSVGARNCAPSKILRKLRRLKPLRIGRFARYRGTPELHSARGCRRLATLDQSVDRLL